MAVAHCCAGAGMAPDDGRTQRQVCRLEIPKTLQDKAFAGCVYCSNRRSGHPKHPDGQPQEAVCSGDRWSRRRAACRCPAGTGAETPPARMRRFRRGAAPTPRLECAQDALGGRMERERPEYLQPIPRTRWEFPWLGLWALLLLGMAGAGIWLHLRTGDAWNARFQGSPTTSGPIRDDQTTQPEPVVDQTAMLAEVRARRAQAEREIQRKRADLRCIDGVAFRRIPGGWENVPGETCP